MRPALVTLLAGLVLAGCATAAPAVVVRGASDQSQDAASATPDPADVSSDGDHDPLRDRPGPLAAEAIDRVLLVEANVPRDLEEDPSFAELSGAPKVTAGTPACALVSQALTVSYGRDASAIRARGFSAGNRGPAVMESVAAFPGGAKRAFAQLRAGLANCHQYRVGTGDTSTTYVVESYEPPTVGDAVTGVYLTGSFPDAPNYITIRVAVVRVGQNLVTMSTFGIFGNDISDDAYSKVIATAVRRVRHAH